MKLHISERIMLLEFLPKEGDYAALRELRKAREALAFTPEEKQMIGFIQEGGIARWDAEKGSSLIVDIPLSEWTTTTIQEELRKRNKEKKLTERELTLYEKFIVAYDQV